VSTNTFFSSSSVGCVYYLYHEVTGVSFCGVSSSTVVSPGMEMAVYAGRRRLFKLQALLFNGVIFSTLRRHNYRSQSWAGRPERRGTSSRACVVIMISFKIWVGHSPGVLCWFLERLSSSGKENISNPVWRSWNNTNNDISECAKEGRLCKKTYPNVHGFSGFLECELQRFSYTMEIDL